MFKRCIIICAVVITLSNYCKGQTLSPESERLASRLISSFQSHSKNKKGWTKARFVINVFSSGTYQMKGKSYYVKYPNAIDTSVTCIQASYVENALRLQGAIRTYNEKEADVFVNVSLTREQGYGRTLPFEKTNSTYSSSSLGGFGVFRNDKYNSAAGTNSTTNPNLPYYKDSFGEAGNRRGKYLGYVRQSDHALSLLIEGFSSEGDLLWQTVSTNYSFIPVSDLIMPYLCFAAIGHFGVEDNYGIQFTSDNPLYKKWVEGLLYPEDTILYLKSFSSNKSNITAVIKNNDTLTVAIRYKRNDSSFRKCKVYLENGDNRYPAIDRYMDGWLHKNYYPTLMILDFSDISEMPDVFDIVFYDKKGRKNNKLSITSIEKICL